MRDTKEKLLEVTARLILKHGWHRVTFRMITKKAGVNLAAINYHFGSREALEDELIPRIVGPMDEARVVALREAEERAAPGLPDLETVLRCFLEPPLEFSERYPHHHEMIRQLFSGIQDKSKLKAHFDKVVRPMADSFTDILRRILPGAPHERLMVVFASMFASSIFLVGNPMFQDTMEILGSETDQRRVLEGMLDLYVSAFRSLAAEAK